MDLTRCSLCADGEAPYFRQAAESLAMQGLQACTGELPRLPGGLPQLPAALPHLPQQPHQPQSSPAACSRHTSTPAKQQQQQQQQQRQAEGPSTQPEQLPGSPRPDVALKGDVGLPAPGVARGSQVVPAPQDSTAPVGRPIQKDAVRLQVRALDCILH